MRTFLGRQVKFWVVMPAVAGLVTAGMAYAPVALGSASHTASPAASKGRHFTLKPSHVAGNLDCNGFSTIQKTIMAPKACTDVRGGWMRTKNTWYHRFYDNGHYIGHDEPDMSFFSSRPGSGNSVNWSETLPNDPAALPTVSTPGSDVTHNFELTIAPWFEMDLCDGTSYPQLPCTPNSDRNAPACFGPKCPVNTFPGGGSAFLEMQFYPPGDAPFLDSISCDNTHWCASLHINELMCTLNFVSCNPACIETTNFAFVQRNGVPTGPPSPQLSDNSTSIPNSQTLLMNPGDKLKVRIFDAPAPAAHGLPAGKALEVSINDLTTGQFGFMQASASNGFAQTDISSCNGRYFNYEPEYSTSKPGNVVPWAAIQANISTEFEIGHFTPCNSVSSLAFNGPGGAGDPFYTNCTSPYETTSDSSGPEGNDFPCFTKGDTHGTLASDPNQVAGCLNFSGGGDVDFDGTPYRADWPTSTTVTSATPSTFLQNMPTSHGAGYGHFLFQTDVALSEVNCAANGSGCSVPPTGPEVDQAGNTSFYPFWSLAEMNGKCVIEFGNNTAGVNAFGRDAQYGKVQIARLGYPEFEGGMHFNHC